MSRLDRLILILAGIFMLSSISTAQITTPEHRLRHLIETHSTSSVSGGLVLVSSGDQGEKFKRLSSIATKAQIDQYHSVYEGCLRKRWQVGKRSAYCRCYASAYLERHIADGDPPRSAIIIRQLSQKCHAERSTAQEEDSGQSPPASDEELAYGRKFYESCQGNFTYRETYNCECLASEVVRARQEHGGQISDFRVMSSAGYRCPNIPRMKEKRYESCLRSSINVSHGLNPESFCGCSVQEWEALYKRDLAKFKIGSSELDFLFATAQKTCMSTGVGATR